MDQASPNYFTNEALARFLAAQGRNVQQVICYLWQNHTDPANPLELIDAVELRFGDGSRLAVSSDGESLDAVEYNLELTRKELAEDFGDKIRVLPVDASATTMWKDTISKTLLQVKLTRQDGNYLSDSLVLDFGEEKREVKVAPFDGVVIDYYEE